MAVPPWLLGRHVTVLTATVQTINEATGALADSGVGIDDVAALAAAGVIEEVRLSSNRETDNISPVSSQFTHHVPIKQGYSLTLSEVMRNTVDDCLLLNIYILGVSNYVLIAFTRGQHAWAGYFLMTGYNETIQRGKNVAQLTVTSVDNGAVTYT